MANGRASQSAASGPHARHTAAFARRTFSVGHGGVSMCWAQRGPESIACSVAGPHGAAGTGGSHRRSPTGGSANLPMLVESGRQAQEQGGDVSDPPRSARQGAPRSLAFSQDQGLERGFSRDSPEHPHAKLGLNDAPHASELRNHQRRVG